MFVELRTSYGSIQINPHYVVAIRETDGGNGARLSFVNQQEILVIESPELALKKIQRAVKHTLDEQRTT